MERVSLVDLLDRLPAGGGVLTGDLVMCVPEVDLVEVSLRALITAVLDGVGPAAHLSKPEFAGALISRRLPAPSVDIGAAVAALPHSCCPCAPTCVSP